MATTSHQSLLLNVKLVPSHLVHVLQMLLLFSVYERSFCILLGKILIILKVWLDATCADLRYGLEVMVSPTIEKPSKIHIYTITQFILP